MPDSNKHWEEQKEAKGGYYGLKLMLFFYNIGGRAVFSIILIPVMYVYYLLSKKQRLISKKYLSLVNKTRKSRGMEPLKLHPFFHFLFFGYMLLDKLKAWQGDLKLGKDVIYKDNCEHEIKQYYHQGFVIFCSHLGDIEALRAVYTKTDEHVINSIAFTEHAENFNRMIKSLSPDAEVNVISTKSIGPDTAILLKEKIDNNEIVAIAADRVPTQTLAKHTENRVVETTFLGQKANLPQGPFVLASVLKCPVVLVFGLKNPKTHKIDIVCKDFAKQIIIDRKQRELSVKRYADAYAKVLEELCLEYPYQWFNFYDFFNTGK